MPEHKSKVIRDNVKKRPEERSVSEPMATILMASFDRLPLLKLSLDSALSQDYRNYEVLVVDDGSGPETRRWLERAEQAHERLRVLYQAHSGVAAARARGVANARGEIVCILDSDDLLVPAALMRLTGMLDLERGPVLAYCMVTEVRPNGSKHAIRYRDYGAPRQMIRAILLRPRLPFKHSGTTFFRSAALGLGSYDRELACKVDIDLYLKFLRAGYLPQLLPEPLVSFRMHKASVSHDRLRGVRTWFRLIDRYGPRSKVARAGIKGARAISEGFKWLYVQLTD